MFCDVIHENKWTEFRNKTVYDTIYLPNKSDTDELSGERYTRTYSELEGHFNWTNNINHHFKFVQLRDLDMVADYNVYLEDKDNGTFTQLNVTICRIKFYNTYINSVIHNYFKYGNKFQMY